MVHGPQDIYPPVEWRLLRRWAPRAELELAPSILDHEIKLGTLPDVASHLYTHRSFTEIHFRRG